MSQSAGDALRKLRTQIENSIEETERAKQYAIDKQNFITAHEFSIAISERLTTLCIIDEMLKSESKDEKHTHIWKSRINSPLHHIKNYVGMYCDCGAILTQSDIEEYVNKWQQEQLDYAQQMRESHKRFFSNVD